MSHRVLVTAANGKVGRATVRELLAREVKVRAGVHHPDRLPNPGSSNANLETVRFAFDEPATIEAALQNIDTLVLITPPAQSQVDWATRTIDLAKQAGVGRAVRLSVLAAAMEPGILLGRWHRTVERYLQGSGLRWTIVRPGPFSANFAGMYPSDGETYALPVADAVVNHIDVRDVGLALAEVATGRGHESQVYMITGPEALTFEQAVARLGQATGKPMQYVPTEADAAHEAFKAAVPEWLADILAELFAAFRTGAVGMMTPAFEQLTGAKPRKIEAFFDQGAPP